MTNTTAFILGVTTMGVVCWLHDWARAKLGKRCHHCGRRVHFADCLCDLTRRRMGDE